MTPAAWSESPTGSRPNARPGEGQGRAGHRDVDPSTFREVLAQVAMPVAVASVVDRAGTPHGLTVGSLCSLSARPPLVLICLDRSSRSGRQILAADRFGLSVLAAEHEDLARSFATHGARRFDTAFVTRDGLPAVRGALGWLACSRYEVLDGGDHDILIGRVERADRLGPGSPLVYHDRLYRRIDPRTPLRPVIAAVP